MKPVNQSISRVAILNQIKDHLEQMRLWAESDNFDRAFQRQQAAQALIELLEADDCGSCGGFDKERGQPAVGLRKDNLWPRYEWLASLK